MRTYAPVHARAVQSYRGQNFTTKRKSKEEESLLGAYLFMRETQLVLQYRLAIGQNLHLVRKRVECVRYGLGKM